LGSGSSNQKFPDRNFLAGAAFAQYWPANRRCVGAFHEAFNTGRLCGRPCALGAKAMFDAMDKDKNAVVTPAEMDSVQKAASRPGDTPPGKLSSAEKIKAVDADHDGNLSADEHVAGSRKMFTMMDTDKDGMLTTAELDAGRKLMLSAK
jgi:hypothetical protein